MAARCAGVLLAAALTCAGVLLAAAQTVVVRPQETCSVADVIVGTGLATGLCVAFPQSMVAMIPPTPAPGQNVPYYNLTVYSSAPPNKGPRGPPIQPSITDVACNQPAPGTLPYRTLAAAGKEGTLVMASRSPRASIHSRRRPTDAGLSCSERPAEYCVAFYRFVDPGPMYYWASVQPNICSAPYVPVPTFSSNSAPQQASAPGSPIGSECNFAVYAPSPPPPPPPPVSTDRDGNPLLRKV